MRYLARYMHRRQKGNEYTIVIEAETMSKATKEAGKHVRAGFVCVGVTSHTAQGEKMQKAKALAEFNSALRKDNVIDFAEFKQLANQKD